MMELLSPAGSREAVTAAVQSGADAVYLGCGEFNARRNAANFTAAELPETVEYCHLRGVKVYLTLNTLLRDRELEQAAETARKADRAGVDAILVQDLGLARVLRQAVPELPLHASTQMTLHDLDGIKLAADLGMTRAVLSRELSRDQIAFLCAHSPIEIEVFVHGALCMCYSGQCFLSSVIGGRSGNRGLCAQPCRLNYGWNGRAEKPLLSLKDMSLAGHLRELEEMGVACAKIEGRMKRPEYVAIVTKIYAAALREQREPTAEELERLRLAFSRQGFTDGYYMDRKGPAMFGVRKENQTPPGELFARTRAEYLRGETPRVPIHIFGRIQTGQPVTVRAEDADGHQVIVTGSVPEKALKRELSCAEVEKQLGKTGGTPYQAKVRAEVEQGLSLPLSQLNGLRREALESLSRQRTAVPAHRQESWKLPPAVKGSEKGSFTLSLERLSQLSPALLALEPARVDLPLEQGMAFPEETEKLASRVPTAITLPRALWDREHPAAEKALLALKERGIQSVVASTWGGVALGKKLGFAVLGGFGLGVCNSETIRGLKALGLAGAAVSFEQRLSQLRDLSRELPLELIAYGRLPLMLTENCILRGQPGHKCPKNLSCRSQKMLWDRKGAAFPVQRAYGCRNELLNSAVLFLADKWADVERLGLSSWQLRFTTESAEDCVKIFARYLGQNTWTPETYTRGLYYREVE